MLLCCEGLHFEWNLSNTATLGTALLDSAPVFYIGGSSHNSTQSMLTQSISVMCQFSHQTHDSANFVLGRRKKWQ